MGRGGCCREHFNVVLACYGWRPGEGEVGWLIWSYRVVHSETCGLSNGSEAGFGSDNLQLEGEGIQVGLEAEVDVEGEDVSTDNTADVMAGLGVGHVGELVEGVTIDGDMVCRDHWDHGGRGQCWSSIELIGARVEGAPNIDKGGSRVIWT